MHDTVLGCTLLCRDVTVLLVSNLLDSTYSSSWNVVGDVVPNPPKPRRLCCHLSEIRGEIAVLLFSFNEVDEISEKRHCLYQNQFYGRVCSGTFPVFPFLRTRLRTVVVFSGNTVCIFMISPSRV